MAVTSVVTVTNTPIRKNRRKMSKKRAPRTADQVEHDSEMDDEQGPAAGGSGPSSTKASEITEDDELMIDAEAALPVPESSVPAFPPVSASAERATLKSETRRIPIPPHRMSPLKKGWINIFGPLTELLGLQVRMNVQRKSVEIRVSENS